MTDYTRKEMLSDLLDMKASAQLLIAMKRAWPGKEEKWVKDIEDLSHIIQQYDGLITRLVEINLELSDKQDKLVEKINQLVPEESFLDGIPVTLNLDNKTLLGRAGLSQRATDGSVHCHITFAPEHALDVMSFLRDHKLLALGLMYTKARKDA